MLITGFYTGATTAETVEFVEVADLTVLMLLVLAKHPCEGKRHALLANGIAET